MNLPVAGIAGRKVVSLGIPVLVKQLKEMLKEMKDLIVQFRKADGGEELITAFREGRRIAWAMVVGMTMKKHHPHRLRLRANEGAGGFWLHAAAFHGDFNVALKSSSDRPRGDSLLSCDGLRPGFEQ